VPLEPEEQIIAISEMMKKYPIMLNPLGLKGYLVLTSKRLFFYDKKGQNYQLMVQNYLKDLENISAGGDWDRYIIINGLKLFPRDEKPLTLAKLIQKTMQTRNIPQETIRYHKGRDNMERIRSLISLEPEENIQEIYEMIRNVMTSGPPEGWNGYFVITSMRLLFYERNGRDYQLIKQILLRDIENISCGGNIMRHIIINEVKFFPKNQRSKTIAKLIESLIQKNRTPQTPEISTASPQIAQKEIIQKMSAQESNHIILCSHCGFQNDIDAIFCSKCGSEL
jgi:ribosomal protein L40E